MRNASSAAVAELILEERFPRALADDDLQSFARLQLVDFVSCILASQGNGQGQFPGSGGSRSSPANSREAAAFYLSARGHWLDYDDTYDAGRAHVSSVIWPALIARLDRPTQGRKLLAAFLAASELFCVLADSALPRVHLKTEYWFLTQLLGGIAAATACELIGDGNVRLLSNAMALAFMQASGTKQPGFGTGDRSRPIYPAFAAHAGVFASRLGREGFEGPTGWLDGRASLGPVYLDDLGYSERVANNFTEDRGDWRATGIRNKPWPCCRGTHKFLRALDQALSEASIDPAEFGQRLARNANAKLAISVAESDSGLVRPIERRRAPATNIDGRYSIPFVVAMHVSGRNSLKGWSGQPINDPDILAVAKAIDIQDDPSSIPSVHLSIGDRTISISCGSVGEPKWSLKAAEQKFFECARFGESMDADSNTIWDDLCKIEDARDVREGPLWKFIDGVVPIADS